MPTRDLARQLAQIVATMRDVNDKLTRINAEWADPPDPDKPAIRVALGDVKAQAAASSSLADTMLARLA